MSGPTKMSGLIWIQNADNLMFFSEKMFEKVDFKKISRRQKYYEKFIPKMQEVTRSFPNNCVVAVAVVVGGGGVFFVVAIIIFK